MLNIIHKIAILKLNNCKARNNLRKAVLLSNFINHLNDLLVKSDNLLEETLIKLNELPLE
jgi:hypothetical protein